MMAGLSCEGLVDTAHSWFREAACRGMDTAIFYVERGVNPHRAYAMCARCVVRRECLDYAIANDIQQGIWGGCSPKERRKEPRVEKVLSLTSRQRVVWLTKQGWTAGEVGRELGCTRRTVERILARERAR